MNNSYNQGVNNTPNMNQPVGNTNNGTNFIDNIPKDKTSLIGYAGAVVVLIASFLKFVVVKATIYGYSASSSFSYVSTRDGKLFLVLIIASAVLIALKKHIYSIFSTGIATLVFIYDLSTVKKNSVDVTSSYITVHWGIGVWLTIIGIALIAASIYLYWKANPDCFKTLFKKNNAQAPQPIANGYQQPLQNQSVNNFSQPAQSVENMNQFSQQPAQPVENMNQMPTQPVNNVSEQNNQFYNGQQ